MSRIQEVRYANRTTPTQQNRRIDRRPPVVQSNRRVSLEYEEFPTNGGGQRLVCEPSSPTRRPLQSVPRRNAPHATHVTASGNDHQRTGPGRRPLPRDEQAHYIPSIVAHNRRVGQGQATTTTTTTTSNDTAVPVVTEIDGRPKTGHGRRRPAGGGPAAAPVLPPFQREFTVVDDFHDARPKTSHGRRRPGESTAMPVSYLDSEEEAPTTSSQIAGPPSSNGSRPLTVMKYAKPLPDIGPALQTAPPNLPAPGPQTTDGMKEPQVLVISDTLPVPGTDEFLDFSETEVEMSPEPKYVAVPLPAEPDGAERRILLAVKMPSGERVQRYFRLTENLDTVRKFAEFMAHRNFDGYRFVCANPRTVFDRMDLPLSDSGLKDRTLLFLQQI